MRLEQKIALETGLSTLDVVRIAATAPVRYKVFTIPKRHGGERVIAQPSRELKILQHYLLAHVLPKLPVHQAATAYRHGISIQNNARRHLNSDAILKLDFQNFFNSIKATDWRRYARSRLVYDNNEFEMIVRILFWGRGKNDPDCLSVGAPTSPMLSNLIMFNFDSLVYSECHQLSVAYSRYADDVTLSGFDLASIKRSEFLIRRRLRAMRSPRLLINDEKTGLYTSRQRRMVTGLVLTPDHKISLGRDRKRMISSLVHRYKINTIDMEKIGTLKGMLGFAISSEPDFILRLREKYGNGVIDDILSRQLPSRSPRDGRDNRPLV